MKAQHAFEQDVRDWLREQESAPAYLAEVFQATSRTRQRGPSITARLADAVANRLPAPTTRAMRIALVGLMLAALLGTVLVVGAIVYDRLQRQVVINPDQSAPALVVSRAELHAIVRTGYGRMPELPPLVLTAIVDDSGMLRISVSETGAVRVEHYDSADAVQPTDVRVYSGQSIGHLYHFDGQSFWYGRGGISEDPRVFVYAALGRAGFGAHEEVCPGGTVGLEEFASSRWTYVGREEVIGRPVDHVACEGGHFWIDTETALVLRSRGPTRGIDFMPTGETSEIEVVDLDFTIPAGSLFAMAPPDGVQLATDEQYGVAECHRSGLCLESPRPFATPPPANADPPALTAGQLVKRALEAHGPDGPYLVRTTAFSSGQDRLPDATLAVFDGTDRGRSEQTFQVGAAYESTSTFIYRDGTSYTAELQPDGSITWSARPLGPGGPVDVWPLQAWELRCESGWTLAGTDLVANRVADAVVCSDDPRTELWIDRELTVLVRIHTSDPMTAGVNVQSVDELTLGPVDPSWFDVPEDVEIDPQ